MSILGTSPQWEDRWGWFKWSVHVHDIDLEDSTAPHWGDDEGLGGGQEEGPVQHRCKNKWAPTQLSGLSHYCASPTYWFFYPATSEQDCGTTWSHMLNELFLEGKKKLFWPLIWLYICQQVLLCWEIQYNFTWCWQFGHILTICIDR